MLIKATVISTIEDNLWKHQQKVLQLLHPSKKSIFWKFYTSLNKWLRIFIKRFWCNVSITWPSYCAIINMDQLEKARILQATKYWLLQIRTHIKSTSFTAPKSQKYSKIWNGFNCINFNHHILPQQKGSIENTGWPLTAKDQKKGLIWSS